MANLSRLIQNPNLPRPPPKMLRSQALRLKEEYIEDQGGIPDVAKDYAFFKDEGRHVKIAVMIEYCIGRVAAMMVPAKGIKEPCAARKLARWMGSFLGAAPRCA